MNTWVLITGATGGLGKAFAVECASRGWDLFLTDLNQSCLETLAGSISSTYGVRVRSAACDLTNSACRTRLFEDLRLEGLRFWGLVNVAGLDYEGGFCDRSRDEIRTILRLNIEGTLEITHALLQRMDPFRTFRIINVASLAAFYPMPVKATYAASKRFLVDFSFALRDEVHDLGATVTVLCPAGMPTTLECVDAIDAQGIMGQLTTVNVGTVAYQTVEAALKGKALVIPGFLNQVLYFLGMLVPPRLVARFIGNRWRNARQKRALQQQLETAF